jgi:DNA-binding NtrC family response regulator
MRLGALRGRYMEFDIRGRVLVVDDDASVARSVCRMLTAAGHEVREARSVPEALALVDEMAPDVVVSDIRLPDDSGVELQLALSRVGLPVVFLTAARSSESAMRLVGGASFRYLQRPVPVLMLQEAVLDALVARRQSSVRPSRPPAR